MRTGTLGQADLSGPAIDLFYSLRDDNHADEAEEDVALDNFKEIKDSFIASQREFLAKAANQD